MNSLKKSLALGRVIARHYGTEYVPSAQFAAFKKKQARFQTDDGLPIFLKAGTRDKILYQTTWVLLLIGLVMDLKLFWELAVPAKND